MFRTFVRVVAFSAFAAVSPLARAAAEVPRPEHPTPDAVRAHWLNLNGPWEFRFDPKDEGRAREWSKPDAKGFDRTITVPFGWESELSGIHETETRGVAWYRRTFRVPHDFPKSDRVVLHFGAVDWKADVWVNGKEVASHEGGYSPFSADVTDAIESGKPAVVVVRVFDPTDPELPTGKQVGWYTPTSGIWQTVWLEARPQAHIAWFRVKTDVAADRDADHDATAATFQVAVADAPVGSYSVVVRPDDPSVHDLDSRDDDIKPNPFKITKEWNPRDQLVAHLYAKVRRPKLWSPESPHLYNATIELRDGDGKAIDSIKTYFGLRSIARGKYGNEPFERLLLNGKPIYLRAALDQSFNPKGLYTAPTDDYLKHDLELAKEFGLNALRIHIKPDEPRRLYWADKLGVLILEDMPNTWKQTPTARKAWEATMREVIARDINHPSIVAWIAFNETWGLGTPPAYKADEDTQHWVSRMVSAIRKLDPSRLVEDNSPCNYDHVENTDLNSWHFYIDDHPNARRHVEDVVARTEPGSGFNYCPGQKQGTAPLINSEYGSVSAGSGDRDVSWGFRDLTTLLRRQPKIQGYVYTELDDIEWEHNGFVNYDRSPKSFGYDAFVPGMTVADLQGADFIGYEGPPVIVAKPGEEITVPVFVSHYSDRTDAPKFRWSVTEIHGSGAVHRHVTDASTAVAWEPYGVSKLTPITITASERPSVGALGLELIDGDGKRLAANFVNVVVKGDEPEARIEKVKDSKTEVRLRFDPTAYARRHWSGPSADLPGKVSGQGSGFFEYRLKLPASIAKAGPKSITLRAELASRAGRAKVDWAERKNGQDYPQTDARKWPSTVAVSVNGQALARRDLADDPADARGVLSHLARVDHGSYGEVRTLGGALPEPVRKELAEGKPLVVRLAVPDDAAHAGGLSVFGAGMGAYPSDPELVIETESALPEDLGAPSDTPLTFDSLASRRTVALAPGDSNRPARWAYTTTDPGRGWTEPDFDDKAWKRGEGGFGAPNTPAIRVRTRWESKSIWLRTSVDLPAIGPDDDLTLHLFHDEDVTVFVNGKPLYESRGYTTAYQDVPLDRDQKALFHAGANTVAVVCRQTGGGQGIDLGLTAVRGE